ncbi:MAG: hypothetical protein HRT68_05655 [Flavobacteriaceae bacterium]|nr:hypothetical protein [Flavobacteriaceae bacterium]
MRYVFVITVLWCLSLRAQIVPRDFEKEITATAFDSAREEYSPSTIEYLTTDKDIESIRYISKSYENGYLQYENETFRNSKYKTDVTRWYETDRSKIYNDGTCNCEEMTDTIFFNQKKNAISDTFWLKKWHHKVIKDEDDNVKESFFYDKKRRLTKYNYGQSYTNISYTGKHIEFRHFQADTAENYFQEIDETGVAYEYYISWSNHPNLAQLVKKNKAGKVTELYSVENLIYGGDLHVLVTKYEYNKSGLPLREISVRYDIDERTFNEADINLNKLYKNIDKPDALIKLAYLKINTEKKYSYKEGELVKFEHKESKYNCNDKGVMIKEVGEEFGRQDYYAKIERKGSKKIVSYYYGEGKLGAVDVFKIDARGNIIVSKNYVLIDGKKQLVSESKLEIKYNN